MKEEKNKNMYYQVKFIIVGDVAVGKTNICYRFSQDEFSNEYENTIVVDYVYQTITIKDKIFKLQLWDTGGSEKYKSITKGFYSNATCCILVYDITEEKSFNSINKWVEEVKNYTNENIIFVLVGNKYDLKNERKVSKEQGDTLASEYRMEHIEASAKTGYNIDEIFRVACQKIYLNLKKNIYDLEDGEEPCGIKKCYSDNDLVSNKTFDLRKKKQNKKKTCC